MDKQFKGYQNTPFLWEHELNGLNMFNQSNTPSGASPENLPTDIRLGHLVEEFVSFELKEDPATEVLRTKAQIVDRKRTIGELDCLLKRAEVPVHLEIIYKLYLYDPAITGELERWIGPNRNDNLVKKLSKIKDQQLPLLSHPGSKDLLKELSLDLAAIKQEVHFKAQLFVPLDQMESSYPEVNNDCVKGFYIRLNELEQFTDNQFHIPSKLDWLVEPHDEVEWQSLSTFQDGLNKLLSTKKSPLCWLKSPEGTFQKFFVVWWD